MISFRPSRSGHLALVAFTTMALLFAAASAPAAGLVSRLSLEALRSRSDVVAIGTVVGSQVVFADGTIRTETTLAVQQSFKGSDGGLVTVVTPGGTHGNITLTVRGVPAFTLGEEVLAFLYEDTDGLHPTGMFQGIWRIAESAEVEAFAEASSQTGLGRPLPAGVRMAWPSSSGGATLVDLEPGPYAVDGGPRGIPELLGSLIGGGQ